MKKGILLALTPDETGVQVVTVGRLSETRVAFKAARSSRISPIPGHNKLLLIDTEGKEHGTYKFKGGSEPETGGSEPEDEAPSPGVIIRELEESDSPEPEVLTVEAPKPARRRRNPGDGQA